LSSPSHTGSPTVSAVTVNWNGFKDTVDCVESLLRQTHSPAEIIVVDNASDCDDADRLAERFGNQVTILRNGTNIGCGPGYNTGIQHVLQKGDSEFILVLNNDVVAHPRMIESLVEAARERSRVGVVGPKIYYRDVDGRSDVLWATGGQTHLWSPQIHSLRGCGEVDEGQYDTSQRLDWVIGAVMLLRTSALRKTGLFNPRYFAGLEDAELCHEMGSHGYEVVYAPAARAWHGVNTTSRKLWIFYVNPPAHYYHIAKCFPWHAALYQFALMPLTFARWTVLFLVRIRNPRALLRSAADSRRFIAMWLHQRTTRR